MSKIVDTLAVGQERAYPAGGNYLTVIRSLQLLEIDLVDRNGSIETHTIKSGTLKNKKFQSVSIKNVGVASVDIVVVTGVGDIEASKDEAVVTVDTSAGSVPVTLDETQLSLQVNQQNSGATNNGLTKITLTPLSTQRLCEAKELRKYVKYNMLSSSNVEYVTVGGSMVDANSGYAMEVGTYQVDETRGELWVHNPSATETTEVWAMEVND